MLKRKGTSNVNVRNGLDKPITKFKTKYQQKGNDIKADEETKRERERERERPGLGGGWDSSSQLSSKLAMKEARTYGERSQERREISARVCFFKAHLNLSPLLSNPNL